MGLIQHWLGTRRSLWQELALILKSPLPVSQGLFMLAQATSWKRASESLRGAAQAMGRGEPVHEALKHVGWLLPGRVASGLALELPPAAIVAELELECAREQEQDFDLWRLTERTVYGIAVTVALFWMAWAASKVTLQWGLSEADTPIATRLLQGLGSGVVALPLGLLVVQIVASIRLRGAFRVKLPSLPELEMDIHRDRARVARLTASHLRSGMPLRQAIQLAAHSVGPRLEASLKEVLATLDARKTASDTAPEGPLLWFLTRDMDDADRAQALEQVAVLYTTLELNLRRKYLETLASVLLVVQGLLVLWLTMAVLSPIFEMTSHVH